jgi:hypothetical protein
MFQLAAEIPLRRLHRRMSQQELNLLQFTINLANGLVDINQLLILSALLRERPHAFDNIGCALNRVHHGRSSLTHLRDVQLLPLQ